MVADGSGRLPAGMEIRSRQGKLSTNSFQLVDKIASDDITAASVFSVSAQGSLLYQEGSGETCDRHVWLDSSGKQISRVSEPGVYGPTRLSPDEAHIATALVAQTG